MLQTGLGHDAAGHSTPLPVFDQAFSRSPLDKPCVSLLKTGDKNVHPNSVDFINRPSTSPEGFIRKV
jgi:hypothetical protein